MEQHIFNTYFGTARKKASTIKSWVSEAVTSKSVAYQQTLRHEISKILSQLYLCLNPFKAIGKKYEIDLLIIYYTSLLSRLDSS